MSRSSRFVKYPSPSTASSFSNIDRSIRSGFNFKPAPSHCLHSDSGCIAGLGSVNVCMVMAANSVCDILRSATRRPNGVNVITPPLSLVGRRPMARQYCPELRIRLRSPVRRAISTLMPRPFMSSASAFNSSANASELYFTFFPVSSSFRILKRTPRRTTGSFNPSVHCRLAHFHLNSGNGLLGIKSNGKLMTFPLFQFVSAPCQEAQRNGLARRCLFACSRNSWFRQIQSHRGKSESPRFP